MAFPRRLKDLCTPAAIYFVVSIIAMALVLLQNIGNRNMLNMGSFACQVPNTALVFIVKLIYILFWTWILNLMCKDGHSEISWFLVLLPWILMFVFIGLVMINQ